MTGVPCSWALLRVVPHPHTGEGAPVAVVLQSRPAEFVGLRAITDPDRLARLAPDADLELLARYLRSCEAIAAGTETAGAVALLSPPERFHWLTAPRSDVLQPGPVHHQSAADPAALLDDLFRQHVATPDPERRRLPRWPFALLAYLFVGLAFVGVVVPGLPTFPFLLLAAWAASRGSRRVHDWLYDHPHFGPGLRQWREQRAISRKAKASAAALFVISWLILYWHLGDLRILIPLGLLFLTIGSWLLTRPEPRDPS